MNKAGKQPAAAISNEKNRHKLLAK